MSTFERKSKVLDDRIPEGYSITYNELRGYDSPDKWHEVYFGDELLGTFERGPKGLDKAIQCCVANAEQKKEFSGARFEVLHINEAHDNHWIALEFSNEQLDQLHQEVMIMKQFREVYGKENSRWSIYFDVGPRHPKIGTSLLKDEITND